jgi:hypothetical protein
MRVAVGKVVEIARYPVKSMAGGGLSFAEVDWQGIEGDRQYSFYRIEDKGRFPWLSGRDKASLVTYHPSFRDPTSARTSPVDVLTPSGVSLALEDPALLAEIRGADHALGLLQSGRGVPDARLNCQHGHLRRNQCGARRARRSPPLPRQYRDRKRAARNRMVPHAA